MKDLLFQLHRFQEKFKIVTGSEKRQDSIYNEFKYIENDTDIVIVHDGVRPFITQELIERCIAGAKQFGSCIAAVPVLDTLKKVKNGKIINTIDRSDLYQTQTPQAFKYEILSESYKKFKKENLIFTDEASLVKWAGYEV